MLTAQGRVYSCATDHVLKEVNIYTDSSSVQYEQHITLKQHLV